MKKYSLPAGYTFLQSIHRTYKQIKDPIGPMQESMEKFNGTYRVHLGTKQFIVTQDPGLIEYVLKKNHRNYFKSEIQTKALGRFLGKGLLTSNGDFWLRQRRLIQPGFHQEKIQALYVIIQNTVTNFLNTFPEGKIDIYPFMNRLAFDIVMNTLFNIAIPDTVRKELSNFISETQNFVIKDLRQPHKSWWFRISGELKRNLDMSGRTRGIIRSIIKDRRVSGRKYHDLLDMLLDARYEDNGEPMDEEQLIDEILVLIIAGHETTANALSWTLFLLASNPGKLEKLREVTAGLNLVETVANEELICVLNESMRLYPPAYISDRVALADDSFNNYTFPGNTIVILFFYGLHRDKKYWDDPNSFIPERFAKGALKEKAKFFFPFGSGPRLCIGNNFAMAEMAIFLQSFVRQFIIRSDELPPKINAVVTLKPDQVVLQVTKLKDRDL